MEKIPTVFRRDPDDMKRVLDEVNPGCEWVLAGEGTPTRKVDGTCVMFDGSSWWARREVKEGKLAPNGFQAISTDGNTGKTVGWEPIEQSPFAKFHAEAVEPGDDDPWTPGTYELCGPKINGDPEGLGQHMLIAHGDMKLGSDLTPAELINVCREAGWEGVVWRHSDGRMAKLKVRDYPVLANA